MPLTSSPPIDLSSIQGEFSAGSLSGAGLAYFGRSSCNMLEFLGASSYSFNFLTSYSASAQSDQPYGNSASAYVTFSTDGTAHEGGYQEGQYGSLTGDRPYTWLIRGNAALVEGYVTASGYNYNVSGPTTNAWINVGQIGFYASSGDPNNGAYGAWSVDWRYNGGPVVANSSITVEASIRAFSGGFSYNYGGSDIRLKRDIVLLETRADGIKVYSFRYKTSEEYYIGVMAQDLLGTQWESAVEIGPDGMYWVDYSKLPVKFELLKK